MTEKKNNNEMQEQQRRLALLALATAKKERVDGCPGSEEFAKLLDGNCRKEERRALMGHIVYCESCYQEWLLLSDVVGEKHQHRKRGRIISFISKKGFLTAAGSVCAVAASLIVFWATPFNHGEKQLLSGPDRIFLEKEKQNVPAALLKPDNPVLKEGMTEAKKGQYGDITGVGGYDREQEQESSPVVSNDVESQVTGESRRVKAEVSERRAARKKTYVPNDTIYIEGDKRKAIQTTTDAVSNQREEVIGDYRSFKQKITVFCNKNVGNIAEIQVIGQDLVRQGSLLGSGQQKDVEKILELLNNADEQTGNEGLCRHLITILSGDLK